MNYLIFITIAIIVFFSILPIIIINRERKKTNNILWKSLSDLADKLGCKISDHDIINDIAIGLDNTAHRLFFIRKTPQHESEIDIALSNVKECRISEVSRIINGSGDTQKVIDSLSLLFTCHSQKEIVFDLYNADYDSLSSTGEFQFADNWKNRISSELSSLNQKTTDRLL